MKFTYIDVSAIDKEHGIISDDVKILKPNEAPSRARKIVFKGTVIYATVRPYLLNIAIIDKEIDPEPIVSTAFAVLHPLSGVLNRYLYYYLRSKPFIAFVESEMTGMAYPAINDGKLYMGLVPLPPSNEQHRIVAKVDQLMSLCDELESRQQKKREIRAHLNSAALDRLLAAPGEFADGWRRIYDNFDLLYDAPENVGKLRQAILQLAVMGKLVEQDERDEPAEVLVENIRTEKKQLIKERKIKKKESFDPIEPEDIKFDIPDKWMWVRFGDITISRDGERIPVSKDERETRQKIYDYYGASGVVDKIDNYLFDKPLLLIGEDGANLLNRSTPIAFIAQGKYWVNNHAHVIDSINFDCLKYLEVFINAIDLAPYVTGTAQPKMNQEKMNSIVVSLPPLAEQRRIVAKVNQLMSLCDKLEAGLMRSQADSERLMEAVVGRMLAGE